MRPLTATLFVFIASLCFLSLQAQSNEVVRMFDANERGIWVRQYEGYADDIHPIALLIGHSEKVYRGLLKEKGWPDYRLEGEVLDDKLQLLVMDSTDRVMGYLQGVVTDSMVEAQWNNVDRGDIKNVVLKRVMDLGSLPSCGKNKSIELFEGQFKQGRAQMQLQREEEGVLYGKLFLTSESHSYSLFGHCFNASCSDALMNISNHLGADLGQMKLERLDPGSANIILSDDQVFLVEKKQEFDVLCGSQLIANHQLSFVIPNLKNDDFQKWLVTRVNQWLKTYNGVKADEFSDRRFWVDLEVIGKEWVCGLMHAEDEASTITRTPFVFDLKKGKEILPDDIISSMEKWQSFRQKCVDGEKRRNIDMEAQVSREWYSDQSFDQMTLRKEGVCLYSDFSRIHGSREIVLPWAMVDTYLKRPEAMRKKMN